MPDWVVHLGVAAIIIWIALKINKPLTKKYYPYFVIGSVSPDFERIFWIVLKLFGQEQLASYTGTLFTTPSHSLLGIIIISGFLMIFFYQNNDI